MTSPRSNPLDIGQVKSMIYQMIRDNYDISEERFETIWAQVSATGVIDRLLVAKKGEDLSGLSIEQLEKAVSDDLPRNNRIALEMVKRPNFNRTLVMKLYNGLGVSVHLGAEGGYGKGIMLKRALNLQQFYTHEEVSRLAAKALNIPETARVFDPTCGSGRLFWGMPNPRMCHGIEIESDAYSIAKAIFPDGQIIQDDTTLHIHEGVMDYVIANPPFTLYWEDRNRLFMHSGFRNRIVSEMAVFESAVRSLKPTGGVIVMVMPSNVWETKFIDKLEFIDWLKGKVTPLAKIELPTHTHEGTVWPTALYFFYSGGTWQRNWNERTPAYPLHDKLASFGPEDIANIVAKFKKLGDDYRSVCAIADAVGAQAPFKLEIVPEKHMEVADYLKTAINIVTSDVITLDAEIPKIGSFETDPITLSPNGLHADLKINALRARDEYKPTWSPARKGYVDVFRERMVQLDAFLDEKAKYDALPLVRGLHQYDCSIIHTPKFKQALEKRKEWMEFQNAPFEIWVDEYGDSNWKQLFGDQGYKVKYPQVWMQWQAKFDAMCQDPQYNTLIPHLNRQDNWLKHLFEFQKTDVIRLSLKASSIVTSQMGLGKTRVCIAAALLKGFNRNLIVVPTRLIDTWLDEFRGLNLPDPILIKYDDDYDSFMSGANKFAIISLETLKAEEHTRPRPKTAYKRRNPEEPAANYDVPSEFDRQADMTNMLISEGFTESEAETLMLKEPSAQWYAENPTREQLEQKETKEMQKLKALQTKPMYADKFINMLDLVIVDEAHNLQNPLTDQSQGVARLKSKQYLFMSVTGDTPIVVRLKGKVMRVSMKEAIGLCGLDKGGALAGVTDMEVRSYDQKAGRMCWAKVIGCQAHKTTEPLIKIQAQYGVSLTVTKNHSVYIIRDGEIQTPKADEIRENDLLILDKEIPVEPTEQDISFLQRIAKNRDYLAYGKALENHIQQSNELKDYTRRNYLRAAMGPCMPIEMIIDKDPAAVEWIGPHSGKRYHYARAQVPVDVLAYFVGIVAGDGWVGKDKRIGIAVADNQLPKFIERLDTLRDYFKFDYDVRHYSGCVNVRLSCLPLGELFFEWFGDMKAATKRLPQEIFSWKEESRRLVLDGLFDSDGYFDAKDKTYTYTTVSKGLAHDIQALLSTLGIEHRFYKRRFKFDFRQAFINSKPCYSVYYQIERKNLSHAEANIKNSGVKIEGASAVKVRAVSIEKPTDEYVYDLSVEGTENFVAGRVVCHNTGTPIKNRVKGLLSLLVIGWGEETMAMPYSKKTFIETFTQFKNIEYEYADSHGYIRTKDKEIEIPSIANPDELRALMAGKWLRRTKYEPEVAADRKFPKPKVNFIPITPSQAERVYAKQWYNEYERIKKEIMAAKETLKALKDRRQWLSGDDLKQLDDIAAELKTKIAIAGIVIGKLRAVAVAPQIEWLTIHTKQHGLEKGDEAEYDEEKLPPLQRLIHIENKYKGGITPRQETIINELVDHVKKRKEQCYTIVSFPEFNHRFLGPELVKRGIRVAFIDGAVSTPRRNVIIESFRRKEIDVLLATIGTFDVGINIPDAAYCCIINPEWNWSDMEQAYSRMIRPASKGERVVDIYFCPESIEKYVKQLDEMKRFNQEYVIDYGPRPPDPEWVAWTDAVNAMFNDMQRGTFNV